MENSEKLFTWTSRKSYNSGENEVLMMNRSFFLLLVIITTSLMGSSFTIGKIGLQYVSSILLVGLRFTIAGVLRFHGQIMTVIPEDKTACYRCIFGDLNGENIGMSCSEAGVIGFIPGILGCLEANESLKYILKIGELVINKILYIDLLRNSFNFIDVYRDERCIACGDDSKDLVEIMQYGGDNVCQQTNQKSLKKSL